MFWGDRRLRRFVVEIVLASGVAACLVAAVTGHAQMWRIGGWATTDALVIAWARQFPNRALVFYGLVALHGRDLIRVTIGITVIYAVFAGPIAMSPELSACAFAALYPRDRLRA